ncbi:SAM-dependent methyltransferase [Microbaculum marinisediminis]|uniref:SAM-dependent methyltransferase n=1 Tax=Microbaculum marinisediminis TaxID=2931392 RepID=A0AAW5QRA7_9HYPH|nr:SAM-dependent methyltransferase [Microbaculum sp. A6E488]MCT8970611.1 SAM-dependent methyltransferase [Microbaculum sp. A6E488]
MTALTRYDEACRALAEAKTLEEVRGISDKMAAVQEYARRANNRQLEVDAAEMRLHADRRGGALLKEIKEAGLLSAGGRPTRPAETGSTTEPVSEADRPAPLPRGEKVTLAELGIDKKTSSRMQKAAGIAADAFDAMIARWRERALSEKGGINLRAAIGTDSATDSERGNNLYETPPEAMHALLAVERFEQVRTIWEPACGRGAICRVLEAAGHEVVFTDLEDYSRANADGELQEVGSFLETRWSDAEQGIRGPWRGALWTGERPTIITNPPYGKVLNAFVAHALREHRPPKMALLLNLNFLCGFDDPDRNYVMDDCPPARIHVFTRRLPMMHRDGWAGPEAESRMNTAWFVWERDEDGDYSGARIVNRVDWKDHQPAGEDEERAA